MIHIIELFVLKCAPIKYELSRTLNRLSVSNHRSNLDVITDTLVIDYINQIDFQTVTNAEKMAGFYKIFFALENDIRDLVEETLEAEFSINWWLNRVPQAVQENVNRNIDKEAGEGLPPRSSRQIDYTTFGELGEIIKDNWESFSGIFSSATKNRVMRVITRLNHARGPIAHCNALPEEEAVRLKLAIRDWYKLME